MTEPIDNEATLEQPAAEETVQEPKQQEPEGLSTRDALAKAINEVREPKAEAQAKEPQSDTPTKTEIKAAVKADIDPPAEFNSAEKKAWVDGDIAAIQRAYRRVNDGRTAEVSRAQTSERQAIEKARPWQRLGEVAEPYIKAQGDLGVPPEQAMMNALALINSMKSEKPSVIKAELKKIGIDLDAEDGAPKADDSKLESLQSTVNALLQEREQRVFEQTKAVFSDSITKLASLKNRTGEPVFPDFYDSSESGKQLAAEIGSLTKNVDFQRGVLRRFPDADHQVLVREAYKYLGGKVSGEPVTVSQNDQKHIEKSRRAAASTPGRVVARDESSNLKGKLSNRAALQRALEESREH
jgi:hypothetical protein